MRHYNSITEMIKEFSEKKHTFYDAATGRHVKAVTIYVLPSDDAVAVQYSTNDEPGVPPFGGNGKFFIVGLVGNPTKEELKYFDMAFLGRAKVIHYEYELATTQKLPHAQSSATEPDSAAQRESR